MFAVNLRWYLREGFIWPPLCFTPYPRFSMRWFRLGLEIIGAASVLLLLAVVFLVFYESSDKNRFGKQEGCSVHPQLGRYLNQPRLQDRGELSIKQNVHWGPFGLLLY